MALYMYDVWGLGGEGVKRCVMDLIRPSNQVRTFLLFVVGSVVEKCFRILRLVFQ